MSTIIFEDLQIQYDDMIDKPQAFSERVLEAAESLKSIMKKNDSVEVYLNGLKKVQAENIDDVKNNLNAVYLLAEECPMEEIDSIITFAKKLVNDLETLRWWRAGNVLANEQGIIDKRTAHDQYIRLREAYNKYVESLEVLEIFKGLPKMPAMPGNYGSTVGLKSYIFFFGEDTEGFRMHLAVCKRLGIESRNLMDTVEYVRSHPDCGVTVKEIMS